MLEVCVDSVESAVNAIHGGADELEVCSSLLQGGITPSMGLVKEIATMANNVAKNKPIRTTCRNCSCSYLSKKPKLNVMIRCRSGADFCYNPFEVDTMLSDIDAFKQIGVDRFVFGALDESQSVNKGINGKIVQRAHPIPVTFHRAIDVCKEPVSEMETIINLGFSRVLTSGKEDSADDSNAVEFLKVLLRLYGKYIQIMPGAGIKVENAKLFIDIGFEIVHSSCKKTRQLPHVDSNLNMGSNEVYITDETLVKNLKKTINLKNI